jgi:chromosome segregation ATPase
MPAQEVSMPEPSASSGLPLILVGTDIRLRLVGRQVEEESLEGAFENPISGTRGTWNLRKTEMAEIGSAVEADLQAWTVLANELSATEKQIETAQAKFDAQQGKLEKLSRFIVDEDSLREKANTRYGATSDAISEARAKLAQLRTDLDAAVRNVELSHRISPRGRLALLARESLQRESRWVEIGLNLLAPQAAPDYEQHLERAHRVKRIIDDIAQEQRLIAEYQAGERYKGEAAETAAEEEFYGGFDQQ